MKIYMVGGFVRDHLLGIEPKDIDYVVVGSSPEEMIALGYKQVGSSFPVYLKDGNEYALARTERKTGVGYNGFEVEFNPTVTLEDDLARRDLTVNSIAMDLETGDIIDPFGGQSDLKAGILRATSSAFSQDPVRILRTARFAARYGFTIEPNTIELMRNIVLELQFVPKERIWAEIEKGLMEDHPHKMFQALSDCGALDRKGPLAPFWHGALDIELKQLKRVTKQHSLAVRFTLISGAFNDAQYGEFRVPSHVKTIAKMFDRHFNDFKNYTTNSADDRILLLERTRAFSTPVLLSECLSTLSFFDVLDGIHVTIDTILADLARAKQIDTATIAMAQINSKNIQNVIHQARIKAIECIQCNYRREK